MSRTCSARLATLFLAGWTVSAQTNPLHGPDLTEALTLYDSGRYAEFRQAIGPEGSIGRGEFKSFAAAADAWIRASDSSTAPRRRLVASTVALELAHGLRHDPPDWAGAYLVWASRTMAMSAKLPPSPAEKLFYLTSLAGMEELDEAWPLVADRRAGNSLLDEERLRMTRGGQLSLARARFPDEPRFLLAQVGSEEAAIAGLDVIPIQDLALRHVHDPIPPDAQGRNGNVVQAGAAIFVDRMRRIDGITRAYQALENMPSIQGEVHLHEGWAESIARNWTAALDHLRTVPQESDERYLRYLSRYLTGRTLQNMGDHAGAVLAFESALAIVPNARSAATQLAAELLLSEKATERARAYALLRGANSDSAPDDPWRLFFHGDARLWPTYMAQLRQALQ